MYKIKQTLKKTLLFQTVLLRLIEATNNGASWQALMDEVYEVEYDAFKSECKELIRRGVFIDVPDESFLRELTQMGDMASTGMSIIAQNRNRDESINCFESKKIGEWHSIKGKRVIERELGSTFNNPSGGGDTQKIEPYHDFIGVRSTDFHSPR